MDAAAGGDIGARVISSVVPFANLPTLSPEVLIHVEPLPVTRTEPLGAIVRARNGERYLLETLPPFWIVKRTHTVIYFRSPRSSPLLLKGNRPPVTVAAPVTPPNRSCGCI